MFYSSRILPLLIIVVFIAFSVRLSEVIIGVQNISSTAFAKSEEPESHSEDKSMEMAAKDDMSHGEEPKGHDAPSVHEVGDDATMPKWRDASDTDIDISDVKMEVFEDLTERRKRVEEAEKNLLVREALLKATEKELDRKYKELDKLKREIEDLLNQQSDEEQKRIDSLVKIYEGMKPKDAARIFDTLDIDVLVSVISKMSERKVAPVLAAMNAERARTVTIMLAEQKNLPELK